MLCVGVHQEVLAQDRNISSLEAGRGFVEAEELTEAAEVGHRASHVSEKRVVQHDEVGLYLCEGL